MYKTLHFAAPLLVVFCLGLWITGCAGGGPDAPSPEADGADAAEAVVWTALFDGASYDGWHRFGGGPVGASWIIEDGAMAFVPDSGQGGDIVTDAEFSNFELTLEWKISPGGNSGIMYLVGESDVYDAPWKTGPEMQVLDNDGHPDGQIETHRAGDLYDLIAADPQGTRPVGEWNEVKIVLNEGRLEHWLNGNLVVETELWTDAWNAMVGESKFAEFPDFGTLRTGKISLQDHGDRVWYRNIRIRNL